MNGAGLVSRKTGIVLLCGLTVLVIVAVALAPRVPQPLSYHNFADHRAWLGIPNFGDVASNLPFAFVGIWGFAFLFSNQSADRFVYKRERWTYFLVFLGLFLTAFGSSYYHLAPDNARLVWDRLPMTIVFMSLVAALIGERISIRAGLALLPVLLLIGGGSVLQWYWSEIQGRGDLRIYAAVQIYAGLVLLLMLVFPAKYTRSSDYAVIAAFYALAKILELTDRKIFQALHIVSGHTLKHLAAAMAGYWILRMLQRRRILAAQTEATSSL
ncbi:MAG TPA: hypothetical protein VGF44_06135 [Terriglobales bacterium]